MYEDLFNLSGLFWTETFGKYRDVTGRGEVRERGGAKWQHRDEKKEITTTASSIGDRMIHQKFMFIFCSQHLKKKRKLLEERSVTYEWI